MIGEGLELKVSVQPRPHWWQLKLVDASFNCPCGRSVELVFGMRMLANSLAAHPFQCPCGLVHNLAPLQPIAETLMTDLQRTAERN